MGRPATGFPVVTGTRLQLIKGDFAIQSGQVAGGSLSYGKGLGLGNDPRT